MPEKRSAEWSDEVEDQLKKMFPKGFFPALRNTIDSLSEPIVDLEDEMRTASARGRHVLDATANVEIVLMRMKRHQQSLFPRLSGLAKADLGGRPNKDEVEGHVLNTNEQYMQLIVRIDALEVLLAYLRGDGYGKGGLKEQVRFRKDYILELSVRERRAMEDELVVD